MSTTNTSAPGAPVASTTPTQPAGQPAAAPAGAPEKTFKIKVDGVEQVVSESDLINLAQQGKSANKRFQEAAQTRKQAEDLIRYAKDNPKEFFAKTGMNAREWAENYLLEQIKQEQMSPEQRKAAENEARLREYENKDKEAKTQAEQARIESIKKQQMEQYETHFLAALTESGLPKTPYTIKRMADLEMVNMKRKLQLTPSQLAKLVREDYIAEQKALFGAADGNALMDILGPEIVKKLSKAQLSKYKAGAKPNQAPTQTREREKAAPVDAWKEMKKRNRRVF